MICASCGDTGTDGKVFEWEMTNGKTGIGLVCFNCAVIVAKHNPALVDGLKAIATNKGADDAEVTAIVDAIIEEALSYEKMIIKPPEEKIKWN